MQLVDLVIPDTNDFKIGHLAQFEITVPVRTLSNGSFPEFEKDMPAPGTAGYDSQAELYHDQKLRNVVAYLKQEETERKEFRAGEGAEGDSREEQDKRSDETEGVAVYILTVNTSDMQLHDRVLEEKLLKLRSVIAERKMEQCAMDFGVGV